MKNVLFCTRICIKFTIQNKKTFKNELIPSQSRSPIAVDT